MKLVRSTQPSISLSLPLGRWSNVMGDGDGAFRELIRADAFPGLNQSGCEVRMEHDKLLGSSAARTSRVWVELGELCAQVFPGHDEVEQIAKRIARGEKLGVSPRFQVHDCQWFKAQNIPDRVISRATLRELSITTNPAYPNGSVQVHNPMR